MQRDSRKAAKKANRTTKNIHEFLKTEEKGGDSPGPTPTSTEPVSPLSSPLKTQDETDSEPSKTAVLVTEDSSSVDPATGEPFLVPPAAESDCGVAVDAEDDALASSSPCASNYASSGPQNDGEMLDGEQHEDSELAEDQLADVIEGVDRLNVDSDKPVDSSNNTSTLLGNEIQNIKCIEAVTPAAVVEKPQLEKVDCKSDLLLFSLEKFCSPEMLKGDNKFACAVCTMNLAEKKIQSEQKVKGEHAPSPCSDSVRQKDSDDKLLPQENSSKSHGITGDVTLPEDSTTEPCDEATHSYDGRQNDREHAKDCTSASCDKAPHRDGDITSQKDTEEVFSLGDGLEEGVGVATIGSDSEGSGNEPSSDEGEAVFQENENSENCSLDKQGTYTVEQHTLRPAAAILS